MAAKIDREDPRRFLHPKTIARISSLDVRAQQVVEGYISGMHRSPFFGHSVEFVQHREYVPGDVSGSMHYGRGPLNKYEYACTAAACLAYLLMKQQDSAGLIAFDSNVR